MTKEEIDAAVIAIMINDGPDHHCDGHGIITDFICALLEGKGTAWILKYNEQKAKEAASNPLSSAQLSDKLARLSATYPNHKKK